MVEATLGTINFKVMKKSKIQIQGEKIAVYFGMIAVMKMHDVN